MQTLFGNRITLQYVQSDIITRAVVKITFTQVHFGGTLFDYMYFHFMLFHTNQAVYKIVKIHDLKKL